MTDAPKSPARRGLVDALDADRHVYLEEISAIGASLWTSIGEAAYRRENSIVKFHCEQLAKVTREAFVIARSLGSTPTKADG